MQEVKSKINQRRAQMLIHSCLYYEMNESIVDDHTWQRWADELQKLQEENPSIKTGFFDREFFDWSGATGNHLNHRHPWVYAKATRILELHHRFKDSQSTQVLPAPPKASIPNTLDDFFL